MSSRVESLDGLMERCGTKEVQPSVEKYVQNGEHPWKADLFAEEQIRALIQQVFFPGGPRSSHQVVFCAVDRHTDAAHVCTQIAKSMSLQLPGSVCLVETSSADQKLEKQLGADFGWSMSRKFSDASGKGGEKVAENLWLVRHLSLTAGRPEPLAPMWLRARLSELRRQFDYAVIHAQAAGISSEPALLGQLCDGVILVLDANNTRRAVARQAVELLEAANAKILGTILNQRTFPIPETIYRKL